MIQFSLYILLYSSISCRSAR